MKNLIKVLVAALLLSLPCGLSAQITKEQQNERKAVTKASKSELNSKVSKAARKGVKKLKKEGWTTTPGALPLEKQLDRSYQMQYEYDSDLYPRYIMGEAMSAGGNYDAAKLQALELAKQNLAGQIQTEVTAFIDGRRRRSIYYPKYLRCQESYKPKSRQNHPRCGSIPHIAKQEQGSVGAHRLQQRYGEESSQGSREERLGKERRCPP